MQYFDRDKFMSSVAEDSELALELLEAYLEDCPARIAELKTAVEADDIEGAGRCAHSLKGMSGVVRAAALADKAFELETVCKNGDHDSMRSGYAEFSLLVENTLSEIRDFKVSL